MFRKIGPFVFATLVAIGLNVAWTLLLVFAYETYETQRRRNTWPAQKSESLAASLDGKPLIVEHEFINVKLLDLDRKPAPPETVQCPAVYLMGKSDRSEMTPDRVFRVPQSRKIVGSVVDAKALEYWYFIYSGKNSDRGYFEGYDLATVTRIGYFGRNGFSPTQPAPEDQFPLAGGQLYWPGGVSPGLGTAPSAYDVEHLKGRHTPPDNVFLAAADRLVAIDFRNRKVQQLVHEPIHSLSWTGSWISHTTPAGDNRDYENKQLVVARGVKRLWLFDTKGKQLGTMAIPDEIASMTAKWWFSPKSGSFFMVEPFPEGEIRDQPTYERTIYLLDAEGKVQRTQTVTLKQAHHSVDSPAWVATSLIASVPNVVGAGVWSLVSAFSPGSARFHWADGFIPMAMLLVVNIVLAVWTVRRELAYESNQWVWPILVLALGAFGYLGYRWHRAWPAKVACGRCGKTRATTFDKCKDCSQALAPTVVTGAEIFA